MDSELIKPKALRPLLLKDYLLDDMSSCSSDGFKSFPRRRRGTSALRFLIEIDQRQNNCSNFITNSPPLLKKTPMSALSALRSVIAALKRIRFAAAKPLGNEKLENKPNLPWRLSVKILGKGSFWKRKMNHRAIGRRDEFNQSTTECSEPLDTSVSSLSTTTETTESADRSQSWFGSESTASDVCQIPSGVGNLDLPHEVGNDAVEAMRHGNILTGSTTTSDSSDVTSTTDSSTNRKQWAVISEDKEQFSPVSVLGCRFEDDEDVSSPYQHRLASMEGTQKQLMKKIKKFGSVSQLQPTSLAMRFASQLSDSDNNGYISIDEKIVPHVTKHDQQDRDDEAIQADRTSLDLLERTDNALVPSHDDKLISDFFRDEIKRNTRFQTQELLEEAENRIDGRETCELFLDWEVRGDTKAYIKDMEKEWRSIDQEHKEVSLELEVEVFFTLLNELFV